MDAGLPGVEFETHGRIASAVARKGGNRASSGQKQRISAFLARFLQLGRVKSDRLLDSAGNATVSRFDRMSGDFLLDESALDGESVAELAIRIAVYAAKKFIESRKNIPKKVSDDIARIIDLEIDGDEESDDRGPLYYNLLDWVSESANKNRGDEPVYAGYPSFWMAFPPIPRDSAICGKEEIGEECQFRVYDAFAEIEPHLRRIIANAIAPKE